MAEILHQLSPVDVGSLSRYLQGFTHSWRFQDFFHLPYMPPFFVEPKKSIRSTLKNHLKRMDSWLSTIASQHGS